MFKRMFSLLLCLVMVLSLVPVQTIAQEIGEETTEPVTETTTLAVSENDSIGSGTPDGTPPVLNGVTISATTVTAPGSIEVIVDASDNATGVSRGSVTFCYEETNKFVNCDLRNYYRENGNKVLYEDGKLHGTINLNQYVETGVFKLCDVNVEDDAGNRTFYDRERIAEELGLIQFTVTDSLAPDGTPPELNSIMLSATTITAPAEIEVIVDASDELSGITGPVSIIFYCEKTEKYLYVHLSNSYFDSENCESVPYPDGKYHGTLTLGQHLEPGIFALYRIDMTDNAGNSIIIMADSLPEGIPVVQFEILESDAPDNTPPVLQELTISSNTITAPGSLEVIASGSDDVSGVGWVYACFYCDATETFLRADLNSRYYDEERQELVPYPDGNCHGMITVDQYLEAGTFILYSVEIVDKAGNYRYYSVEALPLPLPDHLQTLQFKVFNTIPDVITSVSKDTFVEDIINASEDAMIAADFSGDATMPKEAFEAIAGTDKTLDLISEGITWRFEGSDITEEIKDINLNVDIQKVEEDSSGSGDAIEEELGGNPGVVMKFPENGTLPGKATIQIKVDYAMREYLGTGTGLCIYYYNNQTGELELVAENLVVINDTYVEFEITHCSCYVLTTEIQKLNYTYGQNVQIKLIEPWGIRANAKISTSAGVVDYSQLYDYGVYFIRKSALDRAGLTQDTITVADIVNDPDAQKQTKADGVTVSSGYLSAIYDNDIYTYELNDSVFVMFYFITEQGAEPIYLPVRERNLKTLAQQRMNDAANFPNELERAVYQKMTKLEADVADYRSDFANLSAPEKQKAPTLAQYPLGAPAAGSSYSYGQNAQIKLIEPWGLKANVKVSNNGSVINYNAVEEYGIVALADNSRTYADASEILQNQNAYVFSSKNGDATISNGYSSATYSKDIFTYQLDTDIYVFGYVKDADGYHYGPVRNRNVHTLMEARKDDIANFPNVKERTVYADMIDLYNAITAYREDYFNN